MKVKPIVKYKCPSYPDREDVLKNPRLLKMVPERWRGNAYVAAALSSLLLITLTSCSNKKEDVKTVQSVPKAQVAPIFVHGDGRGSFGCMSVAPPAFLSEEEAFTVIEEEAKREGIIFKRDGMILKDVSVPKTNLFLELSKDEKVKTQKGDLALDGVDESKKIAFEFISSDDVKSWQDKGNGVMSTVENFKFKETAEALVNGMKDSTGSMTVAAFYDPHYIFDSPKIKEIIDNNRDDFKKMEDMLKEQVKGDLREQVRDFLSWLKAQGII